MLISMILPAYKVRDYIGACIESCCKQVGVSPGDYEIIIVNDETPDDSIEVAKDVMAKFPDHNFKIVNRKNGGLSAARNSGIEVAEGDYLWFIDSDDYIEGDSLSTLLPLVKQDKYQIINFTHNTLFKNGKVMKGTTDETDACTGIIYLSKRPFLSACTGIYKHEWIEKYKLRFKEGVIWEDSEFNLRAYMLADNCYFTGKSLYNYIRREDSISDLSATPHSTRSRINNAFGLQDYFKRQSVNAFAKKILCRHIMGMLIAAIAGLPELGTQDRQSFRKLLKKRFSNMFSMALSSKQILVIGVIIAYPLMPTLIERLLNNRIHAAIRRSTT